MSAFGIDYNSTLSAVSLREGRGAASKLRLVGDGYRPLIPHAVRLVPAAPDLAEPRILWGSQALGFDGKAEEGTVLRPEPLMGPWLERPGAEMFWQGLMQRLSSYIGRVQPTPESGYDVTIALQAPDVEQCAAQLSLLCEEAGFEGVAIVPSPHALLCRWLAEAAPAQPSGEPLTMAVASVGDTSTSVCAYSVEMRGARLPIVRAASRVTFLAEGGAALLAAGLLEEVAARWREAPEHLPELALRDAALEFGARLSRAPANSCIQWDGPLAEQMFQPLRLSRSECAAWPQASALASALPDALRQSIGSISKGRASVVVVGGVGAMWPFARDAAASVGPVWQSAYPPEDVARGAAWWPEVGAPNAQVLRHDGAPSDGSPQVLASELFEDSMLEAPMLQSLMPESPMLEAQVLELGELDQISTYPSQPEEIGESSELFAGEEFSFVALEPHETSTGSGDALLEEAEDDVPPSMRHK